MKNRPRIDDTLPDGFGMDSESVGGGLDLRKYLAALRKSKWTVVVCVLAALSYSAKGVLELTPQYRSSTLLMTQTGAAQTAMPGLSQFGSANRGMTNELAILRSRSMALRAADALIDLNSVPGSAKRIPILGGGASGESYREGVADRLRRSIQVGQASPDVDMMTITATSSDPEEAALLSDVFAEVYREFTRSRSRQSATATREFLEGQSQRYDSLVTDAESSILDFTSDAGIVDPQFEAQQLTEQMTQIGTEIYRTEFEIRASTTEVIELEAEIQKIAPRMAEQLEANDDEVIAILKGQITQLQLQMELKYSKNPSLRGNENQDEELSTWMRQIRDMQTRLRARTTAYTQRMFDSGATGLEGNAGLQIITNLQNQLVEKRISALVGRARLDALEESRSDVRARLQRIPGRAISLDRYSRERQSREQMASSLFQNLQQARMAEESELGYVEILDSAVVPKSPIDPGSSRRILAALLAGLGLGVGFVLVRAGLRTTIASPDEVKDRGYSLLGVLPDLTGEIQEDYSGLDHQTIDGRRYRTTLITLLNPLASSAEQFRYLRTSIQYSRPDADLKAIVISSPEPGDGKSLVCANLAVAIAQTGRRVILIDGDLRKPTAHKMFGISKENGLTDLLFDSAPMDLSKYAQSVDNLFVIPAGMQVPNPSEVLESEAMRRRLQEAKTLADVVIIDSPPVLAVADTLILSRMADMIIVAVSAGKTHWRNLEQTVQTLRTVVDVELGGIVLNRYTPDRPGDVGYGYGYGYGYNQSYGGDEAE